ncbi:MAG: lipase family protein [Burkholderiaceae bacterium]
MRIDSRSIAAWPLAAGLLLAGCGGTSGGPDRGSAVVTPVQTAALTTAQIDAGADAMGVATLLGPARCGVAISSLEYNTVGGRGEDTNATAAVMVPTGTADGCSGERPVVLYAHGTDFDKTFDMAKVDINDEARLTMIAFAAQGYVVVAPNYTGYARSRLGYHPYLNADAQADDMIDAMRATRAQFGAMSTTVKLGKRLYLSGYSQGGHVAMATQRAMQQRYPDEFTVTASGPMSGPYALWTFSRLILQGQQNIGASLFTPMLVTSYQQAYGNLYTTPSDAYQPPYDTILPDLLPSADPAGAIAKIPAGADGSYRTLFDAGDGSPFIFKTSFRLASQQPGSPYAQALQRNDLLGGWKPAAPMALCYGAGDPTVFGMNSTSAEAAFAGQGATVTRFDVEDAGTVPAAIQQGFEAAKAGVSAQAGGGAAGAAAVVAVYHKTLVPPFCLALVRGFFQGAGG